VDWGCGVAAWGFGVAAWGFGGEDWGCAGGLVPDGSHSGRVSQRCGFCSSCVWPPSPVALSPGDARWDFAGAGSSGSLLLPDPSPWRSTMTGADALQRCGCGYDCGGCCCGSGCG
jgi:hypothetical protein